MCVNRISAIPLCILSQKGAGSHPVGSAQAEFSSAIANVVRLYVLTRTGNQLQVPYINNSGLTIRCNRDRSQAQNGAEVSYRCALLSTKHQESDAIAARTVQLTGTGLHSGRVACIRRAGVGYMLIKESNVLNGRIEIQR